MTGSTAVGVTRRDFFVAGDAGINLAVRKVSSEPQASDRPAIVLLHGARVPGIPSFDLPAPHGSLLHSGRRQDDMPRSRGSRGLSTERAGVRSNLTSARPAIVLRSAGGDRRFLQAAVRPQLRDAATIAARVLLIRSGNDFWSRPEDLADLQHDLIRARAVRAVTIPDATHYVHLDRPDRGRNLLVKEVVGFLAEGFNRNRLWNTGSRFRGMTTNTW